MGQLNDADKYIEAWTDTQLKIWREKLERTKIVRTGALHESLSDEIKKASTGTTITMRFLEYGIYQALGTGRGYQRGNGGDLPFLDKEYRAAHKLDKPRKVGPKWGGYKTSGKPRKPRDWISKKLYMSTMAMLEDMARIVGDAAVSVICDNLTDPRSAIK